MRIDPIYTSGEKDISGTGNISVLFGLFAWGAEGTADYEEMSSWSFFPSPQNFAKSAAVFAACTNNKADAILAKRYIINVTDYFVFKKLTCTVEGTPANITGMKEVKPITYFIVSGDGKTLETVIQDESDPKPVIIK
ncbi:MAG: hypothetical protein NT118_11960 [Lentisphaerae bacterium]|nr:hypothetical protein [Lentisphaerota bacterium]